MAGTAPPQRPAQTERPRYRALVIAGIVAVQAFAAWVIAYKPAWALVIPLALLSLPLAWFFRGRPRAPADHRRARRSERKDDADHHDDIPTLWLVMVGSLGVLAFDFRGLFVNSTALQYVFIFVPLGLVVLLQSRDRWVFGATMHRSDTVLACLFAWGLLGSLYGKLSLGTVSTSLSIFAPMGIFALHLFIRQTPRDATARRALELLANIGALFVFLYLAARLGAPLLSLRAYGHDKAFLLVLAIMAAWQTRRKALVAAELCAIAVIFLTYQAGTFLATAAIVVLSNLLLAKRSRPIVSTMVLCSLACSIYFGVRGAVAPTSAPGRPLAIVTRYFQLVGKQDNSPFRQELLRRGLEQVGDRPILGTNFTGEVAIRTNFPGAAAEVPFHDDYLQLAVGGGLVALALFLGWIIATNALAVRQYRLLIASGSKSQAGLLRVLLVSLNAFCSVSLFNPVLSQVGLSVMGFLIYGSLMQICDQAPDRSARSIPRQHSESQVLANAGPSPRRRL